MKKIRVFAGSSTGKNENYKKISRKLGHLIAQSSSKLFYGGAKVGLMGEVADGCLEEGGEVIGVIPKFLCAIEVNHENLTEMIITETMHERKTLMYNNASMFIALPGGIGTLEELMEVLTWRQLGLIKEKVLIVNIDGYWDNLFKLFKDIVSNNFMSSMNLDNFTEVKSDIDLEREINSIN